MSINDKLVEAAVTLFNFSMRSSHIIFMKHHRKSEVPARGRKLIIHEARNTCSRLYNMQNLEQELIDRI